MAISPEERRSIGIESITPIIGLEIHVELATQSKVFTAAPNQACERFDRARPNTLTDPVVLALPGTLPVVNRAAVELAMRVGLSLGCRIAEITAWDRKGYTYPDLPKGYQLSQYDRPVCGQGAIELPAVLEDGSADWRTPGRTVRIDRAHLEEDAGKLLHEAPGGGRLDGSIVDLNRAGTPLLEIVTAPDFRSADEAVVFCKLLRRICRAAGATLGVMQKGHIRFEPNINLELGLSGGRAVRTPIVEVKNLNSFRAVKAAIEHEIAHQPARWRESGIERGPRTKSTRGWDDARGVTTPQRDKEDADDYRYFPEPDLPPLAIDPAWRARVEAALPPSPAAQLRTLMLIGLTAAEAEAVTEEPQDAALLAAAIADAHSLGLEHATAAREVSLLMLQHGARLANARGIPDIAGLGLSPAAMARIASMRHGGDVSAAHAGRLIEAIADLQPPSARLDADPRAIARAQGWLLVRDTAQLADWCDRALAANPQVVEQIRAGKTQAIGRLIGEVMKHSGQTADAKAVREMLLSRLEAPGGKPD